MYDKAQLIFEMIKTAGLLYELRHGGPNKLIGAMGRFNRATEDATATSEMIEEAPHCAEAMAMQFLEFVYNQATEPDWLLAIEREK